MRYRSLSFSAALLALTASLPFAQAGPSTAVYEVTFDATWSASTHPGAYPANAHFSPLVGGSHSSAVRFWQAGGIASNGMEVMAESGGTTALLNEVNAAITAGTAGQTILGGGANSPGDATATLRVSDDFPLVSLVTMIAPSPDWFVGVDSLNLLQNDQWVDDLEVDLYAWDAGTDSGPNFTSGNQNTNPQDPIALITGGPFFGTTPLGTYTFRRVKSALTYGCGTNPAGSLTLTSSLPVIGQSYTVEVTDPSGLYALGSKTFLALSLDSDPAFPCGSAVPNWNLATAGQPGELLLENIVRVFPGPNWNGSPVPFTFALPNDASLVGLKFYNQGLLISPTKRFGVTEGIEMLIGS